MVARSDAEATEDEVLLLRLTPYGDNDLVVSMIGARLGLVRAFAKSARNSRKRFPGLQPMLMARVHTAPPGGTCWSCAAPKWMVGCRRWRWMCGAMHWPPISSK
jgi:predicted ATPase